MINKYRKVHTVNSKIKISKSPIIGNILLLYKKKMTYYFYVSIHSGKWGRRKSKIR